MLVATSGIIVSSQIAFGNAGGTSPGTSNVGGNGMPATQPLKGGGSGPANGQGVCYGQGADTLVPGQPSGNTQIPNQGRTADMNSTLLGTQTVLLHQAHLAVVNNRHCYK